MIPPSEQCRVWALLEQAQEAHPPEREQLVRSLAADDERLAERVLLALQQSTEEGGRSTAVVVDRSEESQRIETSIVGTVLDNRYEVLEVAGRGGMGIVFRGRHLELEQQVAVKLLPWSRNRDEILREGRRIADVHHPSVVRVLDVGHHGDYPFLVMEWLEGYDLHEWLRYYYSDGEHAQASVDEVFHGFLGQIPDQHGLWGYGSGMYWRFVATCMRDVARAVAHAHQLSVAHQDIAPKNIVVTNAGRTALIDFGLAARVDHDAGGQGFGGTWPYMAPEHRESKQRSQLDANDVYGLGATLLHLIAGTTPDRIERPARSYTQSVAFASSPARGNAVPVDLLRIAWKATHPDPGQRYGSAQTMAEDLDAFLGYRPVSVGRQGLIRSAGLWWKRSPARASLTLAAPLVAVLAGESMRGKWVAAQATAQVTATEDFRESYSRLPVFAGIDHDAQDGHEYWEPDDSIDRKRLDRLVAARPKLMSLRWRRCVQSARVGELDVVRSDLAELRAGEPDSKLLSLMEPLLLSSEREVRHKLLAPNELPVPQTALDHVIYSVAVHSWRTYGNDPQMLESCEALIALDPEDFVSRELYACALAFRRERFNRFAAEQVDKIKLQLGRETATTLYLRGVLAGDARATEAKRFYELGLKRNPRQYQLRHNLARWDVHHGEAGMGLNKTEALLRERPYNPRAYGLLAEGLRKLDRSSEATERLRETLLEWKRNEVASRKIESLEDFLGSQITHEDRLLWVTQPDVQLAPELHRDALEYWDTRMQEVHGKREYWEYRSQHLLHRFRLGQVDRGGALRELATMDAKYAAMYWGSSSPWIAEAWLLIATRTELSEEELSMAWRCAAVVRNESAIDERLQIIIQRLPPTPTLGKYVRPSTQEEKALPCARTT